MQIPFNLGFLTISIINIVLLVIGVYVLVLVIKLLKRAITALDIYIEKEKDKNNNTPIGGE